VEASRANAPDPVEESGNMLLLVAGIAKAGRQR